MEAGISQTRALLIERLRSLRDPRRAEWEKAYQKSSWEHWGLAAPRIDAVLRDILGRDSEAALPIAAHLWREPVWDLKIAAARSLKTLAPTEAVWRFVLERMPDLDGWAVADTMADAGARCLTADPRRLDTVEEWVGSPHLWTRRASLVFSLPWTRNGRSPERMLGWAAELSPDPEWFIQKAIGWWLRDLSKRNPARVRQFLADHGAGLKSVARREAAKYL